MIKPVIPEDIWSLTPPGNAGSQWRTHTSRVFTHLRVRELGSSQPSSKESVIKSASPDVIPWLLRWLWRTEQASGEEMQVLGAGSWAGVP